MRAIRTEFCPRHFYDRHLTAQQHEGCSSKKKQKQKHRKWVFCLLELFFFLHSLLSAVVTYSNAIIWCIGIWFCVRWTTSRALILFNGALKTNTLGERQDGTSAGNVHEEFNTLNAFKLGAITNATEWNVSKLCVSFDGVEQQSCNIQTDCRLHRHQLTRVSTVYLSVEEMNSGMLYAPIRHDMYVSHCNRSRFRFIWAFNT